MLTICIPVYNHNISKLYDALCNQIKLTEQKVEIIIIDDASDSSIHKTNVEYCKDANYIALQNNIGRSKIRNLFLKHACYDYLLFLDCDGIVTSSSFLDMYIENILLQNSDVICGGRIYPKEKPQRSYLLNWEYGVKKESMLCTMRTKHPYSSFMTNNFVVHKSTLLELPFDENITKYGHEDTLFGLSLKQHQKRILHIDNSILNGDKETNSNFLLKTNESITNLKYILTSSKNQNEVIHNIKIIKTYHQLKTNNCINLVRLIFFVSKPILEYLLKKGVYINLIVFDFYKLGILTKTLKNNTKNSL